MYPGLFAVIAHAAALVLPCLAQDVRKAVDRAIGAQESLRALPQTAELGHDVIEKLNSAVGSVVAWRQYLWRVASGVV